MGTTRLTGYRFTCDRACGAEIESLNDATPHGWSTVKLTRRIDYGDPPDVFSALICPTCTDITLHNLRFDATVIAPRESSSEEA